MKESQQYKDMTLKNRDHTYKINIPLSYNEKYGYMFDFSKYTYSPLRKGPFSEHSKGIIVMVEPDDDDFSYYIEESLEEPKKEMLCISVNKNHIDDFISSFKTFNKLPEFVRKEVIKYINFLKDEYRPQVLTINTDMSNMTIRNGKLHDRLYSWDAMPNIAEFEIKFNPYQNSFTQDVAPIDSFDIEMNVYNDVMKDAAVERLVSLKEIYENRVNSIERAIKILKEKTGEYISSEWFFNLK